MKTGIRRTANKINNLWFGKKRYQKFFKSLHAYSLKGMNIGTGSLVGDSGEEYALNYFLKNNTNKSITVFDVGANIGKYTKMLSEKIKDRDLTIHSFEPGITTFKTLMENSKGIKAHHHNFGMSDKNSKEKLFYDKKGSGLASVYKRQLDHFGVHLDSSEEVELRTIDGFCKENKINQIDFLKMDVEGHEISVLKGAKEMLQNGKIKFIQFEFGGCNIDSRTYFQDFYYLLTPKYTIYRILKDGFWPMKHYRETDEIFVTTNYCAVLESNQ